jgi:uncharacterized membrane protein
MKHKILLTIFTTCLAISILLSFAPTESICGVETSSCSVVQNSKYKEILGISNSYFGILIFTALILLTISNSKNPTKNKKTAIIILVALSTIAVIFLLYLQAFVIKAFCPYCMVVDILTIIALIIILTKKL